MLDKTPFNTDTFTASLTPDRLWGTEPAGTMEGPAFKVTIPLNEYRVLLDKATRLDVLTQSIVLNMEDDRTFPVDDKIVRLLTRTQGKRE